MGLSEGRAFRQKRQMGGWPSGRNRLVPLGQQMPCNWNRAGKKGQEERQSRAMCGTEQAMIFKPLEGLELLLCAWDKQPGQFEQRSDII